MVEDPKVLDPANAGKTATIPQVQPTHPNQPTSAIPKPVDVESWVKSGKE